MSNILIAAKCQKSVSLSSKFEKFHSNVTKNEPAFHLAAEAQNLDFIASKLLRAANSMAAESVPVATSRLRQAPPCRQSQRLIALSKATSEVHFSSTTGYLLSA